MMFLNALAWVVVAYFVLWLTYAIYRVGTERNAQMLALTLISIGHRGALNTVLFIIAVLWLIFG